MNEHVPNFGLREDIIAYWSDRAETFDQSFGHGISAGAEEQAWAGLIWGAIGAAPRTVLELACGTGEITRVLLGLGYSVTAIDFAEPMLARARAKLGHHPAVRFRLGDAENCLEPDARYDAVISRHLVWTLLRPQETLRDWFRVLKPGGVLVVIDGNWSEPNWFGKLYAQMSGVIDRLAGRRDVLSSEMRDRHRDILRQLPFADGLTQARLTPMLKEAGFTDIAPLSARQLLGAQSRAGTIADTLRLFGHERLYLRARRPG